MMLESANVEIQSNEKDIELNTEREKQKDTQSSLTKLTYIILIYVFYIFGGLFNEKLTKNEYEFTDTNNEIKKFKFKDPLIILCTLSSFELIVSFYMSKKMKYKLFQDSKISPITFYDEAILGVLHTGSTFTSQLSLLYIDFIVKTIGKSCKSASIIFLYFLNSIPFIHNFLQKLLNNNTGNNKNTKDKIYIKDIVKVIITTISVFLFNLNGEKSSKSGLRTNSTFGILVLATSLFFDGLLSLKEKMIQTNISNNSIYNGYEKIICWEYMKIFALCTFIFGISQVSFNIAFGNYFEIIKQIIICKELMRDLIIYALFDALGQSILFMFLGLYGPLTLCIVTSVRKILSISISIIYFGKTISFNQSLSLILATSIIFWEVYDKGNKYKNNEGIKTS
jgi:hypothetical protein